VVICIALLVSPSAYSGSSNWKVKNG
jgi:hypothetical protein